MARWRLSRNSQPSAFLSLFCALVFALSLGGCAGGAASDDSGSSDGSTETQNNGTFTIPPPVVTGVSPSTGLSTGGTSLTLTGTGFRVGASVSVGGVTCTGPNVSSSTTLTCTTGGHPAGVANITVTNPDTQTASLASSYVYTAAPAPTLSSPATPSVGPSAGGTSVTLTGTGFANGARIYFCSAASCPATFDAAVFSAFPTCTSVSVSSATSLTCTTPTHSTGSSIGVALVNADGQMATLSNAFTFQPPTVSLIAPNGGNTLGNTNVTITGTNFVFGAAVSLGGAGCNNVTVVSPTQITCTTSAHVAQLVAVTVTNSDNSSGSLNNAFTFRPPPSVSNISPNNGPMAGSTGVTINGSGFVSGAAVTIGGIACGSVSVLSATQITCTTASSATSGNSVVLVTNSDAQESGSSVTFLYYAPLGIAPATFTLGISESIAFTSVTTGGVPPYSYTVNGGAVGTVSPGGNYSAPSSPGGPDTVTVTDSATPTPNTATATIKTVKATHVAAGYGSSCAILSDGSLKCWGDNSSGQLGLGDTSNRGASAGTMGALLPPVPVGSSVSDVQLGQGFTCALAAAGAVKCWGTNPYGQLGQGTSATVGDGIGATVDTTAFINLGSGRSATHIAVGGNHVCAILDDSTVKCWGYNAYGQLGYGDTNNRGSAMSSVGDNLTTISFPGGFTPSAIAAGDNHTCAMSSSGAVYCWGRNNFGQLGQENTTNVGDGAGPAVSALTAVNLGSGRTAVSISAGGNTTCARLDNNTAKCWGANGSGQLGQGNTTTQGSTASSMANLTPISMPNSDSVQSLLAAPASGGASPQNEFACSMLNNGVSNYAVCWGYGHSGQLGQLSTNNAGDGSGLSVSLLAPISLGTGHAPQQIAVGGSHACALLDDFSVKCWGANGQGQLGQENSTNRGDSGSASPSDHRMGDNLPPIKL